MRRATRGVGLFTFRDGVLSAVAHAASAKREISQEGVGQMEHFEESTAGRFLTLAIIVPLAAGASVRWDDGGIGSTVIMGSVAIGTILATVGGGAALERQVKYTIAAMLGFPPALLLYFPLVALASPLPAVRFVMGFVALVLVAFLLKANLAPRPREATPARRVVQHLA
jgi:hypothetical protein